MVTLLLVLLWEPAITVAELKSQQNIIAVLVDDSRSMAIADAGSDAKQTRDATAVKTLEDSVLAGLAKKFQTRVYRLDAALTRVNDPPKAQLDGMAGASAATGAGATHINAGLRQLTAETSDLPVGAVVPSEAADGAGELGGWGWWAGRGLIWRRSARCIIKRSRRCIRSDWGKSRLGMIWSWMMRWLRPRLWRTRG